MDPREISFGVLNFTEVRENFIMRAEWSLTPSLFHTLQSLAFPPAPFRETVRASNMRGMGAVALGEVCDIVVVREEGGHDLEILLLKETQGKFSFFISIINTKR